MSDAGAPKKKLRASQSPSSSGSCDPKKCIICQKSDDKCEPTSTENGRTRIIEAAEVRRDVVFERLKQVDKGKFLYHVTNECYKQYTLKKTLDKLKQLSKVSTDIVLIPHRIAQPLFNKGVHVL